MSDENMKNQQPLIRLVNRQQMSWRAVDAGRAALAPSMMATPNQTAFISLRGATFTGDSVFRKDRALSSA